MTSRQIWRTASAKHIAIGAIGGAFIVIALAVVAQAQLRREKERTAEALAEVQRQAELVEASNRRFIDLQAKVGIAEQKVAETNQRAEAIKAEVQRLRAELQKQMAVANELELKRIRDELEDLERKRHLFFPRPRVPDAAVKGTVKVVADNVAVIDLGSENDVKVGWLLQVYRLKPSPQYLGTLEIQRTESHRAVGLFKSAGKDASIQVGDIVDSKIR